MSDEIWLPSESDLRSFDHYYVEKDKDGSGQLNCRYPAWQLNLIDYLAAQPSTPYRHMKSAVARDCMAHGTIRRAVYLNQNRELPNVVLIAQAAAEMDRREAERAALQELIYKYQRDQVQPFSANTLEDILTELKANDS